MGVLAIIGIAVIGSAVVMAWLLWRAPIGYEDADGFHYGVLEERDPKQRDIEDEADSDDTK